jgi:choline monooxygenase
MLRFLDFDFDPRIEWSSTLPSELYFKPEVLDAERRKIFFRTWQLAGRLDQVKNPGDYFTSDVAGEPLLVVRDQSGTLRAFHNVCRHRAGEVATGAGQCRAFRCTYHGWTYGLDGALIGMPDWDGVQGFAKASIGLKPVEIAVWNQFIFARVAESSETLDDSLGDIPARLADTRIREMQHAARRDYVIECNWKVYVDNYLEGYHIPIVHPSLMRELDFEHYRTITSRYSSLQDAPIRAGADNGRRYRPSEFQREALYFWMFPNLMLNVYPDNISTNLIIPLGPQRTLTVFEWYFASIRELDETLRLSDEIQQEDITVCEAVQRGLRSISYDRGRYSVKRENGVHHFHSLWREFMLEPDSDHA